MDIQALMDSMSDQWKQDRSKYHLTLGELHKALHEANPDALVLLDAGDTSPDEAHSYRGYYSDLAFRRVSPPIKAARLLIEVVNSIGETFEGYKGGDFKMDEDTPLWVSSYGTSDGIAMVAITTLPDGNLSITTKQID